MEEEGAMIMHLKNLFNYKIKEKELVKYVGRKNSIILPDWIEKIGRNAQMERCFPLILSRL